MGQQDDECASKLKGISECESKAAKTGGRAAPPLLMGIDNHHGSSSDHLLLRQHGLLAVRHAALHILPAHSGGLDDGHVRALEEAAKFR